jgi:(2R)-3-sulfolactate dehydrogenase (NADP+)
LAAGLTGANWSLDAPSFTEGPESPGSGLFILALYPTLWQPDFPARLERQLDRLSNEHGVHIPGWAKRTRRQRAAEVGLTVPRAIVAQLESAARERR